MFRNNHFSLCSLFVLNKQISEDYSTQNILKIQRYEDYFGQKFYPQVSRQIIVGPFLKIWSQNRIVGSQNTLQIYVSYIVSISKV